MPASTWPNEQSRPESTDVLIIGGGLLGCALSYLLARAGMRVLLVDKGQLNAQASGQNAGSLHFQLEYRMMENGEQAARKAARALSLHLHALHTWGQLEAELGCGLGVVQHGGLMVAETAEQVAQLERKIALEQAAGLPVELLDENAVRTRAPYLSQAVIAAAFCPGEGKADPRRCTLAYAHAALRLGAQVHSRSSVQSLQRKGARWLAGFADGSTCQAGQVAITAGAWSGRLAQMAGIALPVFPVGLTMTVTARSTPLIGHLIQHAGRRLSMKQTAEGNVLIGGGWPAGLHQHGGVVNLAQRPQLRLTSVVGNMQAALAVAPAIARLPVLRIWTGTTSLVADQLPLIGPVPKAAGLFIATGGSAFTLGPVYARMLADQMLGKSGESGLDAQVYDPRRFGSLTLTS